MACETKKGQSPVKGTVLRDSQVAQDIGQKLGNMPRLLEAIGTQEFILNVANDHEGGLAAASELLRLKVISIANNMSSPAAVRQRSSYEVSVARM